ncbi:MAG: MOSC domain-containing protein [Geodermatophilaceae bacterium]|nr:MOSC domain-containing protein [Geodermatophilaceae bacterium]
MTIDPAPPARLVSVQVGRPRDYVWLGRDLRSSIDKHPVTGPVNVLGTHLEGDEQADPNQHGGPDKAVYAYATEDLDWWSTRLGRHLDAGALGENLTTTGLRLDRSVIGEQWHVGTAVLQVSEPRTPCWKLGMRMGDASFPRAFAKARRPGVLLRVIREGALEAGDLVEVGAVPAHGVRAGEVSAMYYGDAVDVARILAAPELADHWRDWAAHRTIWHIDEELKRRDA